MGFKIFMLICALLMPAAMWVEGAVLVNRPPKKISYLFGYRTARSMWNQETWDFAQRREGLLWLRIAPSMFFITLAAALPGLAHMSEGSFALWAAALVVLQFVPFALSMAAVERALKANFDDHGVRKQTDV